MRITILKILIYNTIIKPFNAKGKRDYIMIILLLFNIKFNFILAKINT